MCIVHNHSTHVHGVKPFFDTTQHNTTQQSTPRHATPRRSLTKHVGPTNSAPAGGSSTCTHACTHVARFALRIRCLPGQPLLPAVLQYLQVRGRADAPELAVSHNPDAGAQGVCLDHRVGGDDDGPARPVVRAGPNRSTHAHTRTHARKQTRGCKHHHGSRCSQHGTAVARFKARLTQLPPTSRHGFKQGTLSNQLRRRSVVDITTTVVLRGPSVRCMLCLPACWATTDTYLRSSAIVAHRALRLSGSRPVVGSSRNRIRGPPVRTRARVCVQFSLSLGVSE